MKKGELTRQRIIELSAPLFNKRGYAGCSMSEIMEATGLEKGGIYRYFETKEALAIEAFRFSRARAIKSRTDDLGEIPTATGKLRRVIERFVTDPSPTPGGCPLMNTAIDSDDGNAALRNLARDSFADWRRRLAGIIEDGVSRGEFRPDLVPVELADTLMATLEGALVLSRLEDDKQPLRHVQAMLEHLLRSLEPARQEAAV